MLAYMADPTLVSRFGEKSLQISELYRFEHSLEKIKKVYEAFIRK